MNKQLELKVVLSAIDKMTGPLRGISQQSKRLSVGYKADMQGYRETIKKTEASLKLIEQQNKNMLAAGMPLSQRRIDQEKRYREQIVATNTALNNRDSLMTREMDVIRRRQAALSRGQAQMRSGSMNIAKAGAMGYAGYKFIEEGIDFDSTMSKVHALTRLDKDSEELKALRDQAKHLGATTWATSIQAAEGQAFYAMAGFTPENILKAMPGTLDLARASGIEIGRAADIGSNILQGFGLDASEMDRVGDVLVGTFTRTNVNMEMLGDTMRYVAPIAKGLGVSLEETAAITGILGNVGIQGTQAGTAMRAIFSRLAAGPSMAKKALEEIGIKTSDKNGDLKKPIELLGEVIEKTQKMGNTERLRVLKAIAGQEAATAFMALTEKSSLEDIQRIYEEISNNQGESREVSEKMADNVAGDMQKLSSGWSDIRIAIFEINQKGLRKTIQFLTEIVNKVGEWAKENPQIVSLLSTAAAIGGTLLGVIGGLSLAMGIFNLVVLANPIVLVITSIITAIALLITYKDEIWDFFGSFSKAPGEHALKGIGFISALGNKISNFLNDIPVIGPILRGIFEVSLIPLKMIKLLWTGVIKGLQWIGDNWGEIVGWFEMMWSGIIVTMQPITESIQGIWDTIKIGISITKAAFTALWDSVSEQMQPVVDIFNIIIEAISEMINGIKEFFSFETPGWISAIGDNIAGGFDYLMGNDVIEHKVTPAMVGSASIVAANPVNNNQTNNNNVAINITTETNASPGVIAGAVVNQLHSSGLIGDLR